MAWSFACKKCCLFCLLIDHDCLAYYDHCHHGCNLQFCFIMLSLLFFFCMLHNILQAQIRDAGKEETALAVYWVTDGVDRSQVGFVPWHLVENMGKYNGILLQMTYVYSSSDDSNDRRQKV